MENKNPIPPAPSLAKAGETGGGPLDGALVGALLAAMGCHAMVLDADLTLVACDPGAPAALGLRTGPGGPDILPALTHTHFASRGYRLCGAPIPLGDRGRHVWVFRDVRHLERREELEMVFLHELLSTLAIREGALGVDGRIPRLWELALGLYREVVVPRLRSEPEPDPPVPADPGPQPAEDGPELTWTPKAESPTILVADDSHMVRRLLGAILSRDYQVRTAEDGAQAVTAALEHRPDLILLDALMPGMDGFTACAALKADPRTCEIPVIFLTSLQGEADEVRALDAGAIDFIQKPINAAAVTARIRNHLALKQAKDRLEELAVRDALTDLANRRHFDQALAAAWQRARREGQPVSLILGDVDSFKIYNDIHGHVEGDACLKAVAGALARAVRRPGDLVARYGGEEFVCLLPGTDLAGAQAVAQGIHAALKDLNLPHPQSVVASHVTLSLGVATAHPGLDDGPAGLVEAADRRMYVAKRAAKARPLRGAAPDRA